MVEDTGSGSSGVSNGVGPAAADEDGADRGVGVGGVVKVVPFTTRNKVPVPDPGPQPSTKGVRPWFVTGPTPLLSRPSPPEPLLRKGVTGGGRRISPRGPDLLEDETRE